jgi:hypothetical protein
MTHHSTGTAPAAHASALASMTSGAFPARPAPDAAHVAAALQALLLDPGARPGAIPGQLKDPMLHTIDLMRAMNASAIDPSTLLRAPLPSSAPAPAYSPEQAIERANLVYRLIHGAFSGMVRFDISAYVSAAATPAALIDLVDTNLVAGQMSAAARGAIGSALQRVSDHCQRALTALYLAAISAEFAVNA